MNLTILGKYGPFSVNGGCTSSYLVSENESACLFDVGAGTVSRLLKSVDIDNLKFVFLSHLHFDHISDLGVLSYAITFLKKDKKVKLYYFDDGSENASYVKSFNAFELVCLEENKKYKEDCFEFSFYKMTHPVISHGIKITANGRTLAYTGDSTKNDNLKNLYSNANLVVADGAFLLKDFNESKPHMSIKQVCDLASEFKTKTIVSHINYLYSDLQVEEELKGCKFAVLAKELNTYTV